MEKELHIFKINDTQLPLAITMEQAIDRCRNNAINKKETCSLFVKNKRGAWTFLGNYKPDPESPIPFTYKLEDGKTKKTVPFDVCIAEPAPLKRKH